MHITITRNDQVATGRSLRQHSGLGQGVAVTFEVQAGPIALRPAPSVRQLAASGFGWIPNQREAVSAGFDAASLVQCTSWSGGAPGRSITSARWAASVQLHSSRQLCHVVPHHLQVGGAGLAGGRQGIGSTGGRRP